MVYSCYSNNTQPRASSSRNLFPRWFWMLGRFTVMVRATSWSTDAWFLVVSSLCLRAGREWLVNSLNSFLKNVFIYFVSVCVYRCMCAHINTHGNGVKYPCHRGYVAVRGQLYIAGSLLSPLYWFWALNTDCQTCSAPAVELSCWPWVPSSWLLTSQRSHSHL